MIVSRPCTPVRQRLLLLCGAVVALSMVAGAVVLFSVWSEQRFLWRTAVPGRNVRV